MIDWSWSVDCSLRGPSWKWFEAVPVTSPEDVCQRLRPDWCTLPCWCRLMNLLKKVWLQAEGALEHLSLYTGPWQSGLMTYCRILYHACPKTLAIRCSYRWLVDCSTAARFWKRRVFTNWSKLEALIVMNPCSTENAWYAPMLLQPVLFGSPNHFRDICCKSRSWDFVFSRQVFQ